MPAVSTIVPASMISSPTRTPPGSMDWTGCRHVDVGAPPAQHVGGDGRELLVDLRQHARAGFEQQEANLVAPDARIEAQHVFDERRELAEQFDTDEAAADHDDRQTPASRAPTRTSHRRARIAR